MEYIIIFTDASMNLQSLQVVRYEIGSNLPLTFESENEANNWAKVNLDGLPYQVVNTNDFRRSS